MKSLCLYNPLASRVRPEALREKLGRRPFWGEVTFLSLLEPDWEKCLRPGMKILVYGGDGTIHHSLQKLIGKKLDLYFLPGGTANDFCHHIGLSNKVGRSLDLLENASPAAFDTISANGRHILTGGGFGMGFQIARSANRLKKTIPGRVLRFFTGGKIYSLLMVWHAFVDRPLKMKMTMAAGEPKFREGCAIIFTNQKKLGKDILLAPETTNGDGLFHLVLFGHPSGAGVLASILRIKRGHRKPDSLLIRREAKRVSFRFQSPVQAFGDGEEIPPGLEWDLICHRDALSVHVPQSFHRKVGD